jgi:VCBS repeat-containing protein
MGGARYIGRVGALAVALGVGMAVATGHGPCIASADGTTESGASSTTSPSNTDTGDDPSPGEKHEGDSPEVTPQDATTSPTAQTESAGAAQPTNPPSVPAMDYDASGGSHPTETPGDIVGGDEKTATPPLETAQDPESPISETPMALTPIAETSAKPGQHNATDPIGSDATAERSMTEMFQSAAHPTAQIEDNLSESSQSTSARTAAVPAPQLMPITDNVAPLAFRVNETVVAPPATVGIAALPTAIINVATSLVAILSPFVTPGPSAPAEPPFLWALLAWVRRESTRTFVNHTPDALPDEVTTTQGTPTVIDVVANDTEADLGDRLTVASVTQPAHGIVAINPNGTLTYTPNADFHGVDTFSYTVSDATSAPHMHGIFGWFKPDQGHRDSAGVSVTVNATPIAKNDSSSTPEDTAVSGNVLTNDSDAESLQLTVTNAGTITTGHGSVALLSNGNYTYTPAKDFYGQDSFSYNASDGTSSATSAVTITITPVNDAPVAAPDAYTTDEDTPVLIDALRNDTDVDGDQLDRKLVTTPTNGTLAEINDGPNTGGWTYTPNPDYHGTDTFTYKAFDGTTYSDPVTVTITINPVNDTPIARDDTYTTDEDSTLTVSIPNGVTGNDSDPDDDTALTATLVDGPTHGTLNLNPNGTFTYTPNVDYKGEDTFTYRASDGQLSSATTTVTITINASPITAENDVYTVISGSNNDLRAVLIANDTSTLGNDLGDFNIITEPTTGRLFQTNGQLFYRAPEGFSGTDTFTYTVADSVDPTVVSNAATVTLNVVTAIIAHDDAYTVLMDTRTELSPAMSANDVTAPGIPPMQFGAVTIVTQPTYGRLSEDAGVWSYRPMNGYQGTDSFTYTVADSGSIASNPATVTLTVVPYNPLKASDDAYTILGRPTVLTPTANDTTDLGRPLGAVTIIDGPDHGTLTQTNGVMTYTPATGYAGTDAFTYTVGDSVDPSQVSNAATVTLTVVAYNAILANDDMYSIPFNTATALTPAITFNDATDLGTPLGAVSIVTRPSHGTLSTPGGVLTYTPNAGYSGLDSFTYTISDSVDPTKVSTPGTVTLTVYPFSPIVARSDVYTVLSGRSTKLLPIITANDTTGFNDLGAITILSGPAHGSLTDVDGVLTYRAANDYTGTDSFTYTVSDSFYTDIVSNPATVTLTVVESVPAFAGDDNVTIFTNEPTALTPTLFYNDRFTSGNPPGPITVLVQPVYGTLSQSGDTLTYTPNADFNGVDSFIYTVADSADPTIVSPPALVTLTVTDAITAVTDFYWVSPGQTTELDPTFTYNDINRTGNPLTDPVFGPTRGGVITKVDGKYYYTPPAGFTGLDSFVYTVADSENPARTATVLVFVTVNPT